MNWLIKWPFEKKVSGWAGEGGNILKITVRILSVGKKDFGWRIVGCKGFRALWNIKIAKLISRAEWPKDILYSELL